MEKLDKKSDKDLAKELKELREKLSKLRLGRTSSKPHERIKVRRDVARILTELASRK